MTLCTERLDDDCDEQTPLSVTKSDSEKLLPMLCKCFAGGDEEAASRVHCEWGDVDKVGVLRFVSENDGVLVRVGYMSQTEQEDVTPTWELAASAEGHPIRH